jgi:hypothetical protein
MTSSFSPEIVAVMLWKKPCTFSFTFPGSPTFQPITQRMMAMGMPRRLKPMALVRNEKIAWPARDRMMPPIRLGRG